MYIAGGDIMQRLKFNCYIELFLPVLYWYEFLLVIE